MAGPDVRDVHSQSVSGRPAGRVYGTRDTAGLLGPLYKLTAQKRQLMLQDGPQSISLPTSHRVPSYRSTEAVHSIAADPRHVLYSVLTSQQSI